MTKKITEQKQRKVETGTVEAGYTPSIDLNRLLEIQSISRTFVGPFPPPEMMSEYNKIVPGSADRILKMAEAQSNHRQELEKAIIKSDIKLAERGQSYAFSLAVLSLSMTGLFAYMGETALATLLGGTTVIALVSLFMRGRKGRDTGIKDKSTVKSSER
jgi:uncharacterized membrane protein